MKTTTEIKEMVKDCKNILEVANVLSDFSMRRSDDDYDLSAAAYAVKNTAEKLQQLANRIKRTGEQTLARIEDHKQNWRDDLTFGPFYGGVNSLGELQGSASEFDIACAMYSQAVSNLNGIISRRNFDERDAARKAQRELYTGESNIILNHLEKNGRRTIKQLASETGMNYETVLTAVRLMMNHPNPFVATSVDKNGMLKDVTYQAEVR